MSIATFSLPVDIPWRRLCVSNDMIDPNICDREFPYRWRSSIAVFSYQPPEDQQTYDDMIVSYLKVACTITSFQPNPAEVGLKDRRVDSYWNNPLVIKDYVNTVSKAYPCYGAVLEVGVAPSVKNIDGVPVPLSQYPYFMDFDPKKRELYELVSESGENMSRSLEDINVRKGATTTTTNEKLDILNGISASANVGGGGVGIGASGSVQGQWGTRDVTQQDHSDVRTTDNAREQRENFSHTTQITQMYQQLNSFHLGTNRAVFFLLPRPHIVDDQKENPLTFINGPRKLEGIQEFFLVVVRPKVIKDICVEAYLETAHLGSFATYDNTVKRDTDTTPTLSLSQSPNPRDGKDIKTRSGSINYPVRSGWAIDTTKNGGYSINILKQSGKTFCAVSEIDQNHLVLSGTVKTDFTVNHDTGTSTIPVNDGGDGKQRPVNKPEPATKDSFEGIDGTLEANATVYLQQGGQVETGVTAGLYITGRGVCCCSDGDDSEHNRRLFAESVVFEHAMQASIKAPIGDVARMRPAEANALRAEIDQLIAKSISSPDRYAPGTMGFAETRLVASTVAQLVILSDHPDDHLVTEIQGLDSAIRDKIGSRARATRRSDLLLMSPTEQQDRFGLTPDEVRLLRRAAMGLEGPVPAPEDRWKTPAEILRSREKVTVPLLIGLSTSEAEAVLRRVGITLGSETVVDSPLPAGSVVAQQPEAGFDIESATEVSIQTASGLCVRLPEVIGGRLTEVLCRLRDAGLQSEPTLHGSTGPEAFVAALEPVSGSLVTPATPVSITLRHRTINQ